MINWLYCLVDSHQQNLYDLDPSCQTKKICVNISRIQVYLKKIDDNGTCDKENESTFDVDDSNFYNLNDPMNTKAYLLY